MSDLTKIFESSSMGYIYHKILLDQNENPSDYLILAANPAAEKMLGVNAGGLKNKRILEIIPNLSKDPFDWIGFYGKIALEEGHAEFDQFFQLQSKWFKINVFCTEKYFFHTLFIDISASIMEKLNLQKVISASEQFLLADSSTINYQFICDTLCELSGAKFGVFHLYAKDRLTFKAVAISGVSEYIHKANVLLGFDLREKNWEVDQRRNELLGNQIISRFENLVEFSGGVIPSAVLFTLEKILSLGYPYVVQIHRGEEIVGDFVLLMPKGKTLQNEEIIKLYSRQVGMLLTRNQAEENLKKRLEVEASQAKVSSSFVSMQQGSLKSTIISALGAIGSLANADHSFFFRFIPQEQRFDDPYEWSAPNTLPHIEALRCSEGNTYTWWQSQFSQGNTVNIPDLNKLPVEANPEKELLASLGIKSFVSIPIVLSENLIAFIGFDTTEKAKIWDENDLRMLQTTGEIIGGAIERIDNYKLLQESEKKYRFITENIADVIWIMDIKTMRHTYLSPSVFHLRGYTADEAVNHGLQETLSPRSCKIVEEAIRENLPLFLANPNQDINIVLELEHLHKDGHILWAEVVAKPRINSKGEVEMTGVTRSIENRKRLEAQIQKQSEDQLILLDNIPTQIWYLTDESTCGAVNKAYADFNGCNKEEMEHRNIYDVYPKADAEMYVERNRIVFSTGKQYQLEQWVTDHRGRKCLLLITYTPKLDANGKVEYAVCSAEDISEIRQTQEEIIIAKEQAEESNRLKSAFLASMNHELRTPLNHIMGFSQLISTSNDLQENRECASHIYKSGEALLKMIRDIFDLALAEQSVLRPNPHNVKCFDHFFDNKASLEDIFESSGKMGKIKLIFSPDLKALHRTISIDVGKVNQVLSNLFRNAVKFTRSGTIEFGFELIGEDKIRYFVKDTGIGIPIAKQELIFDFFRQADESNSRVYGGVGIGLAISKKVTEIMQGVLRLESTPEIGSSFYLEVPCEYVDPDKEKDEQKPVLRVYPDFSAYTIMLVEDDTASMTITRAMLQKTGATIIEAKNGREAVDIVESKIKLDLVLMDIKMPLMDGYQASHLIKRVLPDLPIIALTAHAKMGDDSDTKYHRFDAFITKPINRELIYMEVSKRLTR